MIAPVRKPPAKRLFSGMAGSPLAQISEPAPASVPAITQLQTTVQQLMDAADQATTDVQVKNAVVKVLGSPGRPRLHTSDADRKRKQRADQKLKLEQLLAQFNLSLDTEIAPYLRETYELTVKTYRQLLSTDRVKTKLVRAVAKDLKEVFKQHRQSRQSTGGGKFLRGAPAGKGLLISGGYGSQKVDEIRGIREEHMRQLSGKDFEFDPMSDTFGDRRRVTPKGHGADDAGNE